LELVKYQQWVTAAITTVSLRTAECLLLFPLQAFKQDYDKYPVTSLNYSRIFWSYRNIPCNSSTKSLNSRDGDTNFVLFA
jgi:hypothetical protein